MQALLKLLQLDLTFSTCRNDSGCGAAGCGPGGGDNGEVRMLDCAPNAIRPSEKSDNIVLLDEPTQLKIAVHQFSHLAATRGLPVKASIGEEALGAGVLRFNRGLTHLAVKLESGGDVVVPFTDITDLARDGPEVALCRVTPGERPTDDLVPVRLHLLLVSASDAECCYHSLNVLRLALRSI
eukprot:gnl/TRDRNA2_/TRDRNA2_191456_c0_seq1.p1 gnl/TRDRNA2_/TRDRNA2_191456_c0~~gnl/TRDRNA2_/TRDRNA2_191456_c0_seq1.p1  ORF type:complete len:182 (+),score=28.90 gnl/TRDRNA2_/TRDRNA2_191456_c0_seq1:107-652(+)